MSDDVPAERPPAKTLGAWAQNRWVKVAIATALVLAHFGVFALAAQSRLHVPFNSAPGQHLHYDDPMQKELWGATRQPRLWSRLATSRMDAQHYIGFAMRGLSACPTDPTKVKSGDDYTECGLGWLPAYGLIGGVFARITGLEPDVALTLISAMCAIVLNLLWISPTLIKRLGLFEAYMVLLAWNCFPGALYLVMPWTESMTLMLCVGGFVMLANERWFLSALLIGAATGLRLPSAPIGFALGCCLLLAAWQGRKGAKPRWWRPLLAIPLCGWGQFVTMIGLQLKLGNWHAFFDARFAFGDKNHLDRLFDLAYYVRGFSSQCADTAVFVGLLAIAVLTARRALAGFGRMERIFILIASTFGFILAATAALEYWGITRYMMLCPLPFLGMGVLARHHRGAFVVWLCFCAAMYWHVELCSVISHGDPAVCPCQGRVELRLPWQS